MSSQCYACMDIRFKCTLINDDLKCAYMCILILNISVMFTQR